MLISPPVQNVRPLDSAADRHRRAARLAGPSETPFEPVDETDAEGEVAVTGALLVQDAPERPRALAARPFAPLVAQLIATHIGVAQTRSKRRAAFSEAVATYRRPLDRPKRALGAA